MQRVTLSIPVPSTPDGTALEVFSNAGLNGAALAEIDTSRPIGGRPAPFCPLGAVASPGAVIEVVSPALYFGMYRFAARAVDAVGNRSSGTPVEFAVFVNSGPRAVREMQLASVVFGFEGVEQLEA